MRRNLESMLERGQDSPLLRLSLGVACLREGDRAAAVEHLRAAVDQDPEYSAAWKELGRALDAAGYPDEADAAWTRGIGVAEGRGDQQAAKEMTVFLRRLRKRRP